MKRSDQIGATRRATVATQVQLSKDNRTVTVRIPVRFNRRKGRKQVITPAGAQSWSPPGRIDNALLKAIVRAHRWRSLLESGEYASSAELARVERVNDSYVSRILRLTLLSPDLVQAILDGHQPPTLELNELLAPFPVEWRAQRNYLNLNCAPESDPPPERTSRSSWN